MKYRRAIPNFETEAGRNEYAHLIGLKCLPSYIHIDRCRIHDVHDDARIEERENIARTTFRDLSKVKDVMLKYTREAIEPFEDKKLKLHRLCPICHQKGFFSTLHICPICAHIFRSELMVDKNGKE